MWGKNKKIISEKGRTQYASQAKQPGAEEVRSHQAQAKPSQAQAKSKPKAKPKAEPKQSQAKV